ncbi:MAG: CvpA family protein [Bacteroidota bacterium]|nr:CvpA family protein [Bacteroidota bacterium]
MFIDIVCALILATSFYLGYTKGIIKTVFGILSIIIGLLVTLKFSYLVIGFLERFLTIDPRLIIIIGFVLTFILVLIGIRMIGKALEKLLETAHINFVNQLAGGLSSALIALLIFSYFIWFLNQLKVISPETKSASFSYPVLESVPEKSKIVFAKIKPFFSEFWDKTQKAMDKVENKEDNNDTPSQ